jgi:glycosyltransferase involved in cell wall biosynthesis
MPKNPSNIKLSILMLSIPSRMLNFTSLVNKITSQIGDRDDVEILSLFDNKSLHIYEKRNELMKIARGSHIAWLDDDDDVSDDYIIKITEAIEANPDADVISFNQLCFLDGKEGRIFAKMGNPQEPMMPHPTDTQRYRDTLRMPWHWCVWRRDLAATESFKLKYDRGLDGQSEEDIDWLNRLYPKVKKSIYLEDSWLHRYIWSPTTTESTVGDSDGILDLYSAHDFSRNAFFQGRLSAIIEN